MSSFILYKIGKFVALHLPLRWAYGVAVLVSNIRYCFADKDRAAVRDNLKAIFPDAPESKIRKVRREVFYNFAKYLVDFFRFEKMDKRYIQENVALLHREHFDEAIAKGKGGIILTAHLGNWELGGAVVAFLGYPVTAVVLSHNTKPVTEFFNTQRALSGMKVILLGHAVKGCLEALAHNELIALVGDRDFTGKGMVVDFFGKPAVFPEGPAAFALKTGAPIIPGFTYRDSNGRLVIQMEPPIYVTRTGDKEQDTRRVIMQYKSIFEKYIREFPGQWYMFKRFWVS